jgi:nitrite reductase (NO-forming)
MFALTISVGAQESVDFSDESSDIVEITVENAGLSFVTDSITVRRGQTVRLTFVNTGGTHDWVLDEFDAATSVIRSGQSETIEFVADRAGTFEYYCSVPGHRRAGMFGEFVVVE